MNEKSKELADYNHDKVILLKQRVSNELILEKILKGWAKIYKEHLIEKLDEQELALDNNLLYVKLQIDNYEPSEFNILEHSKILTPGLYQMVGIKFLEMDFREVLEFKKQTFLSHLENIKKGFQAVKSQEDILKFLLDYNEVLQIIENK